MTFARARVAARTSRHLPATGSSRLSSVLGTVSGDGMPTAGLAPAQQAAQALIGAEQALVQAESRYVEARADWTAESRRRDYGETNDSGLRNAERALAVADDSRQRARDRVEQLRHRLHDQRLQHLPTTKLTPPAAARGAPEGSGGQSIFARLLRR